MSRALRGAWRAALILIAAALLGAAAAASLEPALVAQGFEHVVFDDKPPNRFTLTPEGAIRIESERSVSLLQRPVQVDLEATPVLAWRWRVDQGVPPTDLTRKGGDDRALAVYVTFPFRPERANLFERLKRTMVEAIAGRAAPGRVICYVFGGRGARGEVQHNPWFGDAGASVILRPAGDAPSGWLEERVDVAADYRRIFDSVPDDPTHLAISADSDDTRTRIRALIDGLGFIER